MRLFLPFPSKRIEIVARAQVDSGTLAWTILIRLKGQEGNLLTRLGRVSRLPQVSQVQRKQSQEGEGGRYIEKEKLQGTVPSLLDLLHSLRVTYNPCLPWFLLFFFAPSLILFQLFHLSAVV